MAWCRKHPEGVLLHLHEREVGLLQFLARELRRLLENADTDRPEMTGFCPALQRKRDPDAVHSGLEEEMDLEIMRFRLERLETVEKELIQDDLVTDDGMTLALSPERADIWLAWITDLRLLLAMVLGLTPDNPEVLDDLDPDDWLLEHRMYFFLSELQELMLMKM
jgi:hypothetical protein